MMKMRLMLFTGVLLAVAAQVFAFPSNSLCIDTRTSFGGLIATGVEQVGEPEGAQVSNWDTTTLEDGWTSLDAGSISKSVCVLNETALVHGGRLTEDETWAADVIHVIRGNVVVPSGKTLTLASGAVVKFTEGAQIAAEGSGEVFLLGAQCADIADDTVGGDTNFDAEGSSPTTDFANWFGDGVSPLSVSFISQDNDQFPTCYYSSGITIGALPTPTRDGYTFLGWFTAAEGGTKISASTKVTDDVTYYAHWIRNSSVPNPTPTPTPEPVPELGEGDYEVGGEMSDTSIPENAASVYDGYLYGGNEVAGTIQAKVARPKNGIAKVTTTIQITGEKKVSVKGELDVESGRLEAVAKNGRELYLEFGVDGMSGSFGVYEIDGTRNFFSSKDKDEKSAAEEILKPYLGAYSMICDGGILSVTIAKKGKVTVKGTYNGEKVSAKAQALIGEEMICIPVIYSKKSVNLAFTIWLQIDGSNAEVIGLGDNAIIGKAGTLKNGAQFIIDGDIGDFIETEDPRTLELLPDNETITVSKSKWLVADGIKPAKVAYKKGEFTITEGKKGAGIVNPSGLKLSFKSKDGSFTGSFTAYAIVKGKLKKHKATVEGVLVNGIGYGSITIKKIGTWAVTIE